MRRRRPAAVAVIALVGALIATLAAAQAAWASCPRATLADVEDEVMCPVCGVPLGLAEAPQAERERAFVRTLIRRCRSKPEIKRALVVQYGPRVLALPQDDGFNVAAYLVPALGLLAASGGIVLAMIGSRRRRGAVDQPAPNRTPPLDPAALARLEAELESDER